MPPGFEPRSVEDRGGTIRRDDHRIAVAERGPRIPDRFCVHEQLLPAASGEPLPPIGIAAIDLDVRPVAYGRCGPDLRPRLVAGTDDPKCRGIGSCQRVDRDGAGRAGAPTAELGP